MSFVSSLLSPIPRTAVEAPKARGSVPRLHFFVPLPVALTMRAMLLASSVVVAVALAILWLASPASAQTVVGATFPTPAGDVTGGMIVGGGAPTYSGSGSNTAMSPDSGTITLNSRRTILDMNGFTLAAEDTLNFVFSAAEDVVLIRVSGYTQIDGTLNVTIGLPNESVTNIGGRVWIVDPEGMVLGAHSAINAGGFLATTAGITDADFFADVARFSGAPVGSAITVTPGSTLTGAGVFGFIAPNVSSGGAVVRGDVVYGSAEAYSLTFTPGALALHTFDIHQGSTGRIDLSAVTGGSMYIASLSSAAAPSIVANGVRTHGAPASGNGDIVVSAGGGVARDGANRMQAVRQPGGTAQDVRLGGLEPEMGSVRVRATGNIEAFGPVTSIGNQIEMEAAGDLRLTATAQVSAPSWSVALSTDTKLVNERGPDAINARQWVVYAPGPTGNVYGGLDSRQTALWGAGIDTLRPGAISGNRYVFRSPATLTFTSLDLEKAFGEDATSDLAYAVAGLQSGVPGVFLGDTAATAFSGEPWLTSAGADPSATAAGSPYPILISQGTLVSAAGYGFAFESAGRLTVTVADRTPPTLSVSCPATVYLNASAEATIIAADGESGLAVDPSGTVVIDTATVGAKTVERTATDKAGNSTTRSCTTSVVYRFGGFQRPINADGSSVFKLGSTVPAKIVLTDVNGRPVAGAVATLQISKLADNVEGSSLEATSTAAATGGSHFRYDPEAGQYMFNLATKTLSTGTWLLRASLDDGTTHTTQISLR